MGFSAGENEVTDVPCTLEQWDHLDAASKACQAKIKICRGLATNILSKAPKSAAIHESVKQSKATIDKLQGYVDTMDGMMFSCREEIHGADVKKIVVEATHTLNNVIDQEKELRAIVGLSKKIG